MKCSKLYLILQMFSFALLLIPLSLSKCNYCWYTYLESSMITDVLTGYCSQNLCISWNVPDRDDLRIGSKIVLIMRMFHGADNHVVPPHSLSPNSCQIQGSSFHIANHMASLDSWKHTAAMPWLLQIKEFSTVLVNYVALKDRFTHWREKKKQQLMLGIQEINQ